MKTFCKSCHNWKLISGERGWCANFDREIMNNTTCGEWRARKSENGGAGVDQGFGNGQQLSGKAG